MKSWKTTLAGALAGVGLFLLSDFDPAQDSIWVKRAGQIMAILGTAATGAFARDANKTSEDHGLAPSPDK